MSSSAITPDAFMDFFRSLGVKFINAETGEEIKSLRKEANAE